MSVFRWLPVACSGSVLLLTLGVALGSGAAEPMRLANLKAAPNVPPVVEVPGAGAAASGREIHPARRALEQNPIYDETNPDLSRLQRIEEATRDMPHDAIGFPDWMAALRTGAISPQAGLSRSEKMQVLDLDIVMRNTKEMPHVLFPHRSHTLWLDCSNCHPAPFLPQAGVNPVSMSQIFRGKYCGMCHDRVAFITFFSCERCHSVAQGASLQKR
jgi:c(7)-type cytochrome triheme protein